MQPKKWMRHYGPPVADERMARPRSALSRHQPGAVQAILHEALGAGRPPRPVMAAYSRSDPQYAGMARLWTRKTGIEERYLDHGFEETSTYLTSPVRFAVEGREPGRWRLDAGAALAFPLLDALVPAGGGCFRRRRSPALP